MICHSASAARGSRLRRGLDPAICGGERSPSKGLRIAVCLQLPYCPALRLSFARISSYFGLDLFTCDPRHSACDPESMPLGVAAIMVLIANLILLILYCGVAQTAKPSAVRSQRLCLRPPYVPCLPSLTRHRLGLRGKASTLLTFARSTKLLQALRPTLTAVLRSSGTPRKGLAIYEDSTLQIGALIRVKHAVIAPRCVKGRGCNECAEQPVGLRPPSNE